MRRDDLTSETTYTHGSEGPVVPRREIPGLTVAFHPNPTRVGDRLALLPLLSGREVELSRTGPGFSPLDGAPHPLADRWISRRPLVLAPAGEGGISISRRGSGTHLEVDGVEVDEVEIDAARWRRGAVLTLAGRVVLVLHAIRFLPAPTVPRFGLVGDSCALLALRQQIARVADLDVPVLLRGATGTGKELVAAALHQAGKRRGGPYVALNMAAVPPSLAAAELFGTARGAFTGALQARPGYFRQADGGTLFLDEIGEMAVEVQALLLRALESGEVQGLGGAPPVPVDVRLVAATDADLEAAVEDGRFRAPLLHRLGGYQIRVPALSERREDVGRLLVHFLAQELAELDAAERLTAPPGGDERPWIPGPLATRLVRHPWPGNVRQLRNAARQLAIACHDREQVDAVTLDDLLGAAETPAAAPSAPEPTRRRRRRPSQIRDDELVDVLRRHRFNLRAVASELGISRTTLYTRIDRCPALRKATDLSREEVSTALRAAGGDVEEAAAELEVSSLALKRRLRDLGVEP